MFTFEKKSHFENGTKLSDLLFITGKHSHTKTTEFSRESSKISFIQNWLNVDNKPYSFDIQVKPVLIEAVESTMLALDYDRIYFEAICFDDHFDLYARYNSIIGSRYLGRFNLSELPEFE